MAAAAPIPWQQWGPSNTRLFQHPYDFKGHINGNRVLHVHHTREENRHSILHLMDFSPLAVTNRLGLGRVVKEPSATYISSTREFGEILKTSLPYVQVVFTDRKFDRASPELDDIWIDKDRIHILKGDRERATFGGDPNFPSRFIGKLEVVDV